MNSKFTPGPWEYQRQDTGVGPSHMVTAQDDAGTYAVCEIHEDCKMDERAPNAKLIAAAPTMFSLIEKKAGEGHPDCIAFMEAFNGTA